MTEIMPDSVLETIARVPYIAFISVLHMYESFGWWRRADYLTVNFAESWNEMHHLLIMESVLIAVIGGGGGGLLVVRPLPCSTYHNLLLRYDSLHVSIKPQNCITNGLLPYHQPILQVLTRKRPKRENEEMVLHSLTSAPLAHMIPLLYHFSECVESHAFETYDKFIRAPRDELKNKPAPEIAIKYYTGGDLYLFDEFQTDRAPCSRRPKIDNLYDVFVNIRDDEAEHCKTMKACQSHGNLCSPHSYPENGFEDMPGCMIPEADCEGIVDCVKKSFTSTQVKQNGDIESNR
ncbi:hypothetical protein CRYUN_Cryun31cG0007700 [Craigia yunnanensis]